MFLFQLWYGLCSFSNFFHGKLHCLCVCVVLFFKLFFWHFVIGLTVFFTRKEWSCRSVSWPDLIRCDLLIWSDPVIYWSDPMWSTDPCWSSSTAMYSIYWIYWIYWIYCTYWKHTSCKMDQLDRENAKVVGAWKSRFSWRNTI